MAQPHTSIAAQPAENKVSASHRWLHHPENVRIRTALFQIHVWTGAAIGLYILMMSVSGSVIVYRDQLSTRFNIAWLVDLHENLLAGHTGRLVNGIGAVCLSLLCLTGAVIWWPGVKNWRRSLTVNWSAHVGRVSWDLHSAVGFWFFLFVLTWGISGISFAFPDVFNNLFALFDPRDNYADQALSVLSSLHFGKFNWLTRALWACFGLVPAIEAVTGVFLCCHRVINKRTFDPMHGTHQPL